MPITHIDSFSLLSSWSPLTYTLLVRLLTPNHYYIHSRLLVKSAGAGQGARRDSFAQLFLERLVGRAPILASQSYGETPWPVATVEILTSIRPRARLRICHAHGPRLLCVRVF